MKQETENIVGNFAMGEWMGEVSCIHSHAVRLFNIGKNHYVACDKCRTYMHVGRNLRSAWRSDDKDEWQRNQDSIEGYKEVLL